jgi:predicted DNA-binding transcriptional regulator YafY
MRVYRVSRVASVAPLQEVFERPTDFELAAFWTEWSHAFEESRPKVEVVVRRLDGEEPSVMTFEHLGEAHRELLRFGAQVEVLEPPELRERLAETSRRLAALYGAS